MSDTRTPPVDTSIIDSIEAIPDPKHREQVAGGRIANLLQRYRGGEINIGADDEIASGVYESPPHAFLATRPEIDREGYLFSDGPHGIGFGPKANKQALKTVQGLFPGKHLSMLSDEGSSAVVFEDGEGHAFKVMREPGHYSYGEDEAAALTLLSGAGLAPKMHALIDARPDYQSEEANRVAKTEFGDVSIRRKSSPSSLPVIVMDKVDFEDIDELEDDKFSAEFDRVMQVALEHGLIFGDVEFVVEETTGKVMIVDAGGMGRYKPGKGRALLVEGGDFTDAQMRELTILRSAAMHFNRTYNSLDLEEAYRRGGIRAVTEFMSRQPQRKFDEDYGFQL